MLDIAQGGEPTNRSMTRYGNSVHDVEANNADFVSAGPETEYTVDNFLEALRAGPNHSDTNDIAQICVAYNNGTLTAMGFATKLARYLTPLDIFSGVNPGAYGLVIPEKVLAGAVALKMGGRDENVCLGRVQDWVKTTAKGDVMESITTFRSTWDDMARKIHEPDENNIIEAVAALNCSITVTRGFAFNAGLEQDEDVNAGLGDCEQLSIFLMTWRGIHNEFVTLQYGAGSVEQNNFVGKWRIIETVRLNAIDFLSPFDVVERMSLSDIASKLKGLLDDFVALQDFEYTQEFETLCRNISDAVRQMFVEFVTLNELSPLHVAKFTHAFESFVIVMRIAWDKAHNGFVGTVANPVYPEGVRGELKKWVHKLRDDLVTEKLFPVNGYRSLRTGGNAASQARDAASRASRRLTEIVTGDGSPGERDHYVDVEQGTHGLPAAAPEVQVVRRDSVVNPKVAVRNLLYSYGSTVTGLMRPGLLACTDMIIYLQEQLQEQPNLRSGASVQYKLTPLGYAFLDAADAALNGAKVPQGAVPTVSVLQASGDTNMRTGVAVPGAADWNELYWGLCRLAFRARPRGYDSRIVGHSFQLILTDALLRDLGVGIRLTRGSLSGVVGSSAVLTKREIRVNFDDNIDII